MKMLIVGASVRAAAYSAWRAGLQPWSADLFGDRDLRVASARAGTPCRRVQRYPHDFLDISRQGPAGPWMYTGALENHPALVDRIARARPLWGNLWGNQGMALGDVRSPFKVFRVLREAGLACPTVYEKPADVPREGSWLVKPRAGTSGRGIAFFSPSHPAPSHASARNYFQEFVEGEPCAAVYCAGQGKACLLGVTRQLVGEPWLHAAPFQYCGSIGPLALSSRQKEAFDRLGNVLASSFQLQGLFGIDGVLRGDLLWPVEINPRYTASVEVLELATGLAALAHHGRAFERDLPLPSGPPRPGWIGKAIYFADRPLIFPADGPWEESLADPWDPWRVPAFADIPHAGEAIGGGRPVLTLFSRGTSLAECRDHLQHLAAGLDRRFI